MTSKIRFSDKLMAVFHAVFFAAAGMVTLSAATLGLFHAPFFGEDGTEPDITVFIGILRLLLLLLFIGALFLFFLLCLRALSSDRLKALDDRRLNTNILLSGVGLILVLQLLSAYFLRMEPITDIVWLETYVKKIIPDNSFACLDSDYNLHYIAWYPNNIPCLLLYTLIYKLTCQFTGTLSRAPMLVFNTLCINAAVLMTVLTSRRLFGERKAVFTLLLCGLFAPYYTYAPFYYTDTFSIPMMAGTVYFFVAAVQCGSRVKKALLLLLSGAVCCLGFELKATVAVLLPALLLYLLLDHGIKRAAKTGGIVLLGFAVVFGSFTFALKKAEFVSEESADRYEFPIIHWAMMGLGHTGQYSAEDFAYTNSFETKAEKSEADLKELRDRLGKMGVGGLAVHLWEKAAWIYTDGTYNVSHYIENSRLHTPLHSLIIKGGRLRYLFFAYSFGMQMILLSMMTYSGFAAFRKRKYGMTAWLRIGIFGMFLFFAVWEANSRYLFNFTPLYILLSTEGLAELSEKLRKKRENRGVKHAV